jgi:SAM-dependent methyltransferase
MAASETSAGAHGREAGYDDAFYDDIVAPASRSAAVVVPLVLGLGATDPISSVVDVGCGLGTWLAAFVDHGVTDVVGVESDHLSSHRLAIGPDQLVIGDLADPPPVGRRFDLAMTLEVAEHLPPERADRFVAYLCSLAPMIMFSAAIPSQGGVHHVNEQWPAWWARRFASHGYRPFDWLRPQIWSDDRVAYYYAQNTIIYVADGVEVPGPLAAAAVDEPLALVHPLLFDAIASRPTASGPPSLSRLLRELPGAATRAGSRRLKRAEPAP